MNNLTTKMMDQYGPNDKDYDFDQMNQFFFERAYMAVGRFLRRNLVSITFPTVCISLIFLDWNYTRKWKQIQQSK